MTRFWIRAYAGLALLGMIECDDDSTLNAEHAWAAAAGVSPRTVIAVRVTDDRVRKVANEVQNVILSNASGVASKLSNGTRIVDGEGGDGNGEGILLAEVCNGAWSCAFGGSFSEREIADMTSLALGEIDPIAFGAPSVCVVIPATGKDL